MAEEVAEVEVVVVVVVVGSGGALLVVEHHSYDPGKASQSSCGVRRGSWQVEGVRPLAPLMRPPPPPPWLPDHPPHWPARRGGSLAPLCCTASGPGSCCPALRPPPPQRAACCCRHAPAGLPPHTRHHGVPELRRASAYGRCMSCARVVRKIHSQSIRCLVYRAPARLHRSRQRCFQAACQRSSRTSWVSSGGIL